MISKGLISQLGLPNDVQNQLDTTYTYDRIMVNPTQNYELNDNFDREIEFILNYLSLKSYRKSAGIPSSSDESKRAFCVVRAW